MEKKPQPSPQAHRPKKRRKKAKKHRSRLITAAWIASLFLVILLVYWFSTGKEQYSDSCFSNGEAAVMVGIYPEANHYFRLAMRYSNAPKTLGDRIKKIYCDHRHQWEDKKQFSQAERVMGFILELFPNDEQLRRYAGEMKLLFTPSDQLSVGKSQLFPGVNGHFLKDNTLLLEDFNGQRWILDPIKLSERKVFPLRRENLLSVSPSAACAAVIDQGRLAFMSPEGKILTKTNLAVRGKARCSWSPDESKVAIDAIPPAGDPENPFIALVDAVSGEIRQFEGKGVSPAWSPSGDDIAFLDASSSLTVCNSLEGKMLRRIPLSGITEEEILWSPRGNALLVQDEAFDLEGKKLFSPGKENYLGFCWAPSGNKIAAAHRENSENKSLSIFDLDGSEAKIPLAYPLTACDWSADGTRLALNYRVGPRIFLNLIALEKKRHNTQRIAKPRIPS